MTHPVRLGLIGAGFAADIHARNYRRLADVEAPIVVVAATTLDKARAFADRHTIPDATDDYDAVLSRDDVDVVDLCVPNYLHMPFAVAAAQAGKHIVCEKPLTGYFGGPGAADPIGATPKKLMLEEALRSADQMVEAAEVHGVKLMYAENWLYAPAIAKARQLAIAAGGTILEVRGEESHSGSHAAYAKRWSQSGGGALVRLGAHPIGAAIHLKWQEGLARDGNPITVQSVTAETGDLTQVPSFQAEAEKYLVTGWEDVETWAAVILTFSDGSRGTFFASDASLGGMVNTFDVTLSNARLRCNTSHSDLVRAYAPDPAVFADTYLMEKLETKAGWSSPSVDEEWLLGYPQELQDFVEAVAYDRPPLSDARLGREVVGVLYAAYLSAETGRRVELGN